jgi:hypothetical protein
MRNWRPASLATGLLISFFICVGLGYATQERYVNATTDAWIYDAIRIFVQEGLITNYPQDWVKSGHELSRFEIAYYVKQLLEKSRSAGQPRPAPPSKRAMTLVQKLMVEFAAELDALGIKATDLEKISPNLIIPTSQPTDYQDLDTILGVKSSSDALNSPPYYYFGQYYAALQRKSFVFLPAEYVTPGEFDLLESNLDQINVVYQYDLKKKQLFLVVKGNLPLQDEQMVSGYFMFPLAGEESKEGVLTNSHLEKSIIALVDEVNQLQRVENIRRYEGRLSLNGYLKLETGTQRGMFSGNIDQGIKVGSLLVYTDNPGLKPKIAPNDFGLPSYSSRRNTAVDWDLLKENNLDALQINIQGKLNLTPQTALYGGIDLFYQDSQDQSLFEDLLPPEAKYSAGVNYQMNNYWTLLSYQSFVSSNSELLSTTSLGVEYNDWITLWLAYQMLDFKSDRLTGVITFRF